MLLIPPRVKDLGGFTVRRILPYATHRMVGPFIFFDHMGPAHFTSGHGIDVRPHPHINLATVTYLFQGAIHHRDSLGSDQLIEPGAINWMIAGRGIVHSERTPTSALENGQDLHGIQLWVALPEELEEIEPSFSHHPKSTLPEFEIEGVATKLLLGKLFGLQSPVPVHSDMFYAEAHLKAGQSLQLVRDGREAAAYVVEGAAQINGELIAPATMAIAPESVNLEITAREKTRVLLLGGKPLGKRFIEWNFVSSSQARIEEAKRAWANGPQKTDSRFKPIPEDDQEFIPLPG